MRVLVAGVLVGAMLMGANGLMAKTSEPTNSGYEQWFRTKMGRTSPSEEARLQAQAVAENASVQTAVALNNAYEQWFRAKFGRTSPSEEARLRSNPAFNEEVTSRIVGATTNNSYELWYQAKFGRIPPK